MNPNRGLAPSSFYRFPLSFSNLWEDVENQLSKLTDYTKDSGLTLSEDDQNVYVDAELAGFNQSDIDVTFHHNTLRIKAEKKQEEKDDKRTYIRRSSNTRYYQVDLPAQVNEKPEEAELDNGVLKITFKKAQQAQHIKINIGQGKNKPQQKK